MVLDFANESAEIQKAFQPYYERTLLSESTDPNLLYDYQQSLAQFDLYSEAEIEEFAVRWFKPKTKQEELYAVLRPVLDRFKETPEDEREEFRSQLVGYVRLYAFLSQLLTFTDADLEKLYVFARMLRRYLPARESDLPREIQQNIDMESYRIQQTHQGKIALERGEHEVTPRDEKPVRDLSEEEKEALSSIIQELNERFGTDFSEADRVSIEELEERLATDSSLAASMRANTQENARLTFDHVVSDRLQEMVDTNFKLYKRVTDDPQFSKYFVDWLFDRFRGRHMDNE